MEVKCAINSRVRIGLFIQVNGLDRLYFIMLICQLNHGNYHKSVQKYPRTLYLTLFRGLSTGFSTGFSTVNLILHRFCLISIFSVV